MKCGLFLQNNLHKTLIINNYVLQLSLVPAFARRSILSYDQQQKAVHLALNGPGFRILPGYNSVPDIFVPQLSDDSAQQPPIISSL